MAKARQPVTVNGIAFDALIESEESYEAEVPAYPTEKGFSVSDTVVLKPDTLSMTLYVTDTPVTWKDRNGSGQGKAEGVAKRLKELFFSKQMITVTTSAMVYTDMAITGIGIRKSREIGYALEIPVSFQRIIVTESTTVTIPDSYGKSGKTGAPAGTANTKTADNGRPTGGASGSSGGAGSSQSGGAQGGKSGSVLYSAARSFGLL